MKKLLLSLGFITVLGASTIVGVTASTKSMIYREIYIITDGNNVYDGSFNEASFTGANNFLREKIKKDDANRDKWKIAYVRPKDINPFNLESAYASAARYGAKNLIFPGFNHGGPNIENAANILEKCGGDGILVDISTDFKRADGTKIENMVSLSYKMEVATLYAGLSSIGYFFKTHDQEKTIKLSSFGGMSNPFAVDNFMFGFLLSIEVFNKIWADEKLKIEFAKIFDIDSTRQLKAERIGVQNDKITDQNFNFWYSNSFEPGHASAICEKLINDGANVILPVAGPQITDLVSAIKNTENRDNLYIVGVDIDAITAFPEEKTAKRFITSAIKPLGESIYSALAHTKEYIDKEYDPAVDNTTTQYLKKNGLEVSKIDGVRFTKEELNGTWAGNNIWFTGTISTSGNKYDERNKVTDEEYQKLKKLFEGENVAQMSAAFYQHFMKTKFENQWAYLNDIFGKEGVLKKLSDIVVSGKKDDNGQDKPDGNGDKE